MIDSKKFARVKMTALRVRYANKSTQRRCGNNSIVYCISLNIFKRANCEGKCVFSNNSL